MLPGAGARQTTNDQVQLALMQAAQKLRFASRDPGDLCFQIRGSGLNQLNLDALNLPARGENPGRMVNHTNP